MYHVSLICWIGSPLRSSYVSPSKAAASALAKEALDRIDKLRALEKRVRELREDKFREYFELSTITGDWVWKRDISSGDFMSSISSDLYWNAGSVGLLAGDRRSDVRLSPFFRFCIC